jgi:hypothetical protein
MDTMERYDREMFPLGMDDGGIERFWQVHRKLIKGLIGREGLSELRLLPLLTDILLRLEAIENRLAVGRSPDHDIKTIP